MSDARFEGAFSVNGHNPSFSRAKSEYSPPIFPAELAILSVRGSLQTQLLIYKILYDAKFVIKALFPCVYADSIHQDILLRSR